MTETQSKLQMLIMYTKDLLSSMVNEFGFESTEVANIRRSLKNLEDTLDLTVKSSYNSSLQ